MLMFVKKILQKSQVSSPKMDVSLPDSAYITLNFQSNNPHKFSCSDRNGCIFYLARPILFLP